jgi:hypothetical protein
MKIYTADPERPSGKTVGRYFADRAESEDALGTAGKMPALRWIRLSLF